MRTIANHKADREELNQLIDDYEQTMEEFNNRVKEVLEDQSNAAQSTSQTLNLGGISIVEPIEVFNEIQAINTFWNGMVEADNTAKSKFSNVHSDVQELEGKIVTFLEAIGKNGGKIDSLDIEQLRSAIFEDKGMLNSIENKLIEGKSLSAAERDLLYQYLQKKFFGKEDHDRMEELSHLIEHDNDKLKEHINEEVLTSEKRLEAEILFLELYLFTGNERPDDLNGSEEDRIKLNNYLQILKNAHIDISETRKMYNWDRSKEDPLFAQVENIEFELSGNPVSGHSKSEITIMAYPELLEESFNKEDAFKLDEPPFGQFSYQKSISDIEYFFGSDGITNHAQRDMMNSQDEIKTYTEDFISAEIFSLAVGLVPGEKAINALLTGGEYVQGKKENEQKLTLGRLEQAAMEFDLELQVSNHRLGHNLEIKLIPSEKTVKILDRWKAVHQVDGSIPYPETEIDEQDWATLNTLMFGELDDKEGGYKAEMIYDENGNIDRDLYDFIMDGDESENATVKKAQEITNH